MSCLEGNMPCKDEKIRIRVPGEETAVRTDLTLG